MSAYEPTATPSLHAFNPYVGPRPYEQKDLDQGRELFGRDWEAAELLDLLIGRRIVLLYSPSGAGKTSLIHAKLIQELELEHFKVMPVIRVSLEPGVSVTDAPDLKPENRLVYSTLLSLEAKPDMQDPIDPAELAGMTLSTYCDRRLGDQEAPSAVLIFDQFEEVLTVDPLNQEQKVAFFAQLGAALRPRNRWALFSLREDFVAGLDPYLHLVPTQFTTTFRLDLLNDTEALEAVKQPAAKVDVEFDDEAADALVNDLCMARITGLDGKPIMQRGPYVEPVVLQVVCQGLWEKLGGATQIHLAHLELIGNVDRALADFYGDKVRAIAQQTGTGERMIREWFDRHLITSHGIRGQVLHEPESSKGLPNRVIDALVGEHLVRAEQRRGALWYELAHDRLIEPIIESNRLWLQENLGELQQRAQQWDDREEPPELLLYGQTLTDAERWADENPGKLTTLDHRFLDASRKAIDDSAEQLYEQLTPREQNVVRTIFLRLTSREGYAGSVAEAEFQRAGIKELTPDGEEQAQTQALLERLQAARLITISRDEVTDDSEAMIADPLLSRRWTRLHDWHTEDPVALQVFQEIRTAAQHWAAGGNDQSLLVHRDSRLTRAEALLGSERYVLNTTEAAYLAASIKVRERENEAAHKRAVTLRRALRAALTLLIIMALAVIVAIGQSMSARRFQELAQANANRFQASECTAVGLRNTAEVARQTAEVAASQSNSEKATAIAAQATANADRARADEQAAIASQARATAEVDRTRAELQARVGQSLLELNQGNADRAVLLARSLVQTDTQSDLQLASAIRRTFEATVRNSPLTGHPGQVWVVSWSPDGRSLLTGDSEGNARIWDATTNELLHEMQGPKEKLSTAAWSPNGQLVATGSLSGTARIYDVASGTEQTLPGLPGESVIWSPDGQQALFSRGDGQARLIRASTPDAPLLLTGHTALILAAAWSPDGLSLLTGGTDRTARIWDLTTGNSSRLLKGHQWPILSVAWHPDGGQVLTGSQDNSARIWDVETGLTTYQLLGHTDRVGAVAWSPRRNQVLTASADGSARIWEVGTGKPSQTLIGHKGELWTAAWSPNGEQVATGGSDKSVRIWDAATGVLLSTLLGHTGGVRAVAWRSDGTRLSTGSDDHSARIWNVATGVPVRILPGHTGELRAAVWSPDGRQVFTGGVGPTSYLWDTATRHISQTMTNYAGNVLVAAWSPDGRRLLTGASDQKARIWDASGGILHELHAGTDDGWIWAVSWSPDGQFVLTGGGDKIVRMWNVATGQLEQKFVGHTDEVFAVAWSPSGKRLLSGSKDSTARLWDAETGKQLKQFEARAGWVLAVAWRLDEKQIVTGSEDQRARIWDVATGQLVKTLEGHIGEIRSVAWSPDGQQMLTASAGTARIWDIASGEAVQTLEGHIGVVFAANWSPDGRQVVTGASDRTARLWIVDDRLVVAELTRRLCNLEHGHIFTEDDIHEMMPSWRGCADELEAVDADLRLYDALQGGS